MKKLMKVLPIVMVVCMVVTSVFAKDAGVGTDWNILSTGNAAGEITGAAANVWQTVITIVRILAVAAVVFAGLRYMFASADQKADIKKSMGILAIGAVLVFGATLVLDLINNATNSIL